MDNSRVDSLKKMIDMNPADSFAIYALGLEYSSASSFAEAIELFEKLLQMDPGYLAAYYQLGKAYEAEGDVTAAQKIFEKGIFVAASQSDFHTKEELEQAIDDLL